MEKWLDRLGYAHEPELLHRRGDAISPRHPYALEIHALLKADGAVRARATFDVEGVPTVVLLDGALQEGVAASALDEARQRIWNQNLATVVIHVSGDRAVAVPSRKLDAAKSLRLEQVRRDGPFSASDVVSANLTRRMPEWFDREARVDHKLLDNISTTVLKLTSAGFNGIAEQRQRQRLAELLMGEILFVSYLEHRRIVGDTYRERREVGRLSDLVGNVDRGGVMRLIESLRSDFNGDFLAEDSHDPWVALTEPGYELLDSFLRRTDMRSGQRDFWNYDFSYIPVELLSGLYEQFLSPDEQTEQGAFYTPRHLASLAVDQALAGSQDPLAERIFDGACGSGILLTTAFRRLIGRAENGRIGYLGFGERCELLQRAIFGGDTNPMACRVTAFSLYLSVFEGLEPADIMEAQERDAARLPKLTGPNLASGAELGDVFKKAHAFAGKRFSLAISNPPWREPRRGERTSADDWAEAAGEPVPRRQVAGAFAIRTLDFLEADGRACLILPMALLLGSTSSEFVARLLRRYQPLRLINFGDLQELLFPTATHGCHVFVAERRRDCSASALPFRETFDYSVPKADLTLALGHLSMQSADLHRLQTVSVIDDPQLLVSRMWGDANDTAIWTRLTVRGTFRDFTSPAQGTRRWVLRKGIHLSDRSREDVSAEPLRSLPHVRPQSLATGAPVMHPDLLEPWPASRDTVVGLNEAVMRVFDGPRVLFPDGFSQLEPSVRAYYYDAAATFTHSVGVMACRDRSDAPLLKLAAVYLRSDLARYFVMLRTWKTLSARNGVHLADIRSFPFFRPEAAPNPGLASRSLTTLCTCMDELAALSSVEQPARYRALREQLNAAVFDYFGIADEERMIVRETVEVLLPSVRPRSFKSLLTPAQRVVGLEDYRRYASALGGSLTSWRTRMGGEGRFRVSVKGSSPSRDGPLGIVRVDYMAGDVSDAEADTVVDDHIVLQTLEALRRAGLRHIASARSLVLTPDTHVWIDGSLYLARQAFRRGWTVRQALRDAEQIVRLVNAPDST